MGATLDFAGALARWPVFAEAAVITVLLSAAAMVLGMGIGLLGAAARLSKSGRLRHGARLRRTDP